MSITKDINKIIHENENRKRRYFFEYNPAIGDPSGGTIPRIPFKLSGTTYYIPKDMLHDDLVQIIYQSGGDIKEVVNKLKLPETENSIKKIERKFFKIRVNYDFEFFAFIIMKIQNKINKKLIKFKLNSGQRILLAEYEKQRLAGIPIRVILVKARQWGGSTLTQLYMLWLQLYHYENWHSAIIATVNSQAANIRSMLNRAIKNLPSYHDQITIKPFEGMQNIKYIPQRGCVIAVTSAEEPDALRSFDFSMVHMSEVGLWKATLSKSPDDVAQAVYATIPDEPGTFICIESTAKGVGGFFHLNYLSALDNKSNKQDGLQPVFIAWFNIQMYSKEIKDYTLFINGMSEYNWWQWEQGATLEGINWYNNYKRAKKYSDFQMKSEFPTTDTEAFQSKSGLYFNEEMIKKLNDGVREPEFIGDIRGDGLIGEKALQGIKLHPNSGLTSEVLKIWIMPNFGINPDIEKVTNRFIVTVDIGGLHYKSDNSIISVFDRMALMEPHGAIERAALWIGHIDHDILAWKAVQVAIFYNNALLLIESNTIDSRDKKNDENYVANGDHTYTVLNKIEEIGYPNLYYRKAPPDISGETPTRKIGWHMNKQTKYLAYDTYYEKIRENEYIEHSREAVTEAQSLEIGDCGSINAMKGARDDIQDTTSVGIHVSYDFNTMTIPKIVCIMNSVKFKKKQTGGISTF